MRREEARIRNELAGAGAKIASWTSRVSLVNAGFNTATFNYINRGSEGTQAVDMRRDVTVKLVGALDAEPYAAVLGRNGIRNGVTFIWSSSRAAAVREELAPEAVAAATEKARRLAERAGGKAGAIVDLTVGGVRSGTESLQVGGRLVNADSLFVLPSASTLDELIEDDSGLGLMISVTAHVTLQAKVD